MNLETINLQNIDLLQTEEATKMTLILPFIQQLGYNIFDNNEVIPEYTADIAKRNGEKVDYAIKIGGKLTFLIETKHVEESLDKHTKQLSRYFVNTEAKIGILTNGVEYRFYTDLDKDNIMDSEPFFIFDLINYSKKDLEYLKEFQKEVFDETKLYGKAEKSKKIDDIVKLLSDEFSKPSEEFIKFIVDKTYEGIKTKSVLEEHSEYIQQALVKYIDLNAMEKFKIAFPEANIGTLDKIPKKEETKKKIEVETTLNEIAIFSYIKLILKEENQEVTLKDNLSYCSVTLNGKITKWMCRIYDKKEIKVVIYSNESEKEVILKTPIDIFDYSEDILEAYKEREN